MRSDDHADLVLLEELVDDVRSVAHDIVLLLWVTNRILLHAKHFVGGSRITPEEIHAHLLNSISDVSKSDTKWSLNLVDILQLHNRVSNAAMHAQDPILSQLVLNDGTEGHPLEQVIHFLEDTFRVINAFIESLGALLSEA